MELAVLEALNAERAARRATLLVTELGSGRQRVVRPDAIAGDPLAEQLTEALRTGRSRLVEHGDARVFLTVQVPSPRLVITGAVHISQALAPMAASAGFDVIIIDPRTAFATPERFPAIDLRAAWPDRVLPELRLDGFTAFAALTHDPKIDDPALVEALARECFYIGALGSRKTHAARLERLAATGIPREALARIHAPIGLDIGAVSPAEIAVAILGEVIADLRRRAPARERAA
ncbi:XdhC family protein [Ancylobacter amanitiformis]|uniref:Xanthine dehydrogenase accessory factor n=1 Tax=Ancylobacter amanitiformis TaxID=217069 RepID=A0ABU0LKS3_9HYPH|nr:XdhC family protein [Ancylobacter amanitiformis]MDQ0509306.1 xanthine dehydrogenase accessory factor [Ancylobacter amanitiformis]